MSQPRAPRKQSPGVFFILVAQELNESRLTFLEGSALSAADLKASTPVSAPSPCPLHPLAGCSSRPQPPAPPAPSSSQRCGAGRCRSILLIADRFAEARRSPLLSWFSVQGLKPLRRRLRRGPRFAPACSSPTAQRPPPPLTLQDPEAEELALLFQVRSVQGFRVLGLCAGTGFRELALLCSRCGA